MTHEFTREQDEFELFLMAYLAGIGVEIFIDENERPSMLSELMSGSFAHLDRAFWKLVGGLS